MANYFLAILLSVAALQAQESLTMDECVRRANEVSPVVSISQSKVDELKANKREAVATFWPQLVAKGVWDNKNETLSGDLTQFQDFQSNTAGGISARLGLFDFGASLNHLKASSLFIQASEWQQKKMLLDLEETVRNAYLRVLEAQHAFAVADHSMKTLSKQQEISQAFFEQGIVTKRDTLSVELQLSQKKRDHLAARNGVIRAKMELNRLIGNEITAPMELQELSETVDAEYNDQKIVEYALRHRPELKALSKRSEALAKEKQALKLSNAPNFYAFTNADFSSKKGAVSAGIGLHMPIFEGGKCPAQIAKVRAQKREVDETLRDFRERLEVDIQVALLQLKEERDNLGNGKLAIELGEGNFTKTGDLYKEGQASINDLLYAEEQLSASHLRYHSSLYRYYSTLYRLSTLAGGYPINNEQTHE